MRRGERLLGGQGAQRKCHLPHVCVCGALSSRPGIESQHAQLQFANANHLQPISPTQNLTTIISTITFLDILILISISIHTTTIHHHRLRGRKPHHMSSSYKGVLNEEEEEDDSSSIESKHHHSPESSDSSKMGFSERALSAAGAAFFSAIIVNPLDVAKTRLQAQAAGVPYHNLTHTCSFQTNTMLPDTRCFPSCHPSSSSSLVSEYKGTLDVFYKVIRQEGFARLWRGTSASLALSVPTVAVYLPCYDILRNYMEQISSPTIIPYAPLVAGSVARSLACITCYPVELARTRMQAFKDTHHGERPSGVWKTLVDIISTNRSSTQKLGNSLHSFRFLWTGLGAQLARDVPFSAICWATLEPVRRQLLALSGDGSSDPVTVVGANFSAGFVAGCLAGACTCPLDVAKTRRQIEKDEARARKMTTRQTLIEIWRDGGLKGLFMGVAPRVGRAGPSVAIVVSFYEVVKYVLQKRKTSQT